MTTTTGTGTTASPAVVTGLASGNYTVTMKATSAAGTATSSQSGVVAVTGAAAATWLASGATATAQFAPSGLSTTVNADNTTAIQNAINAANSAGGGIVTIPAGTYYLQGHLQMKSNVYLQGSGPGLAAGNGLLTPTTTLKAGSSFYNAQGPNGGYPIVTTNGAANTTIANFIADGSSNLYGSEGMGGRLAGYLIDVRNSTNTLVQYITTAYTCSYQIVACGSTRFSFVHNHVVCATNLPFDQCDGIHILDSNTGQVLHNTVDNRVGTAGDDGTVAHTINAEVYGVEYGWNYVRGGNNGGGMQLAVGAYAIHDLNIHDNEYYGSPYGVRSGGYAPANGAQYNITVTRCNIHDVVAGTDFPDGSGPSCSIGALYEATGSTYGNSISDIRVANFNTQPAITGGTITGVVGASAASPVIGALGA